MKMGTGKGLSPPLFPLPPVFSTNTFLVTENLQGEQRFASCSHTIYFGYFLPLLSGKTKAQGKLLGAQSKSLQVLDQNKAVGACA